jgi:hypothetical protein
MQSLSSVRTVIFVLLFSVVLCLEMQAQNAAVSGTVTDSTGAVVSDVQVTVRNLSTNLSRTTTSSATGAYSITNLEVGTYDITAKKEGFRTFHLPSVDLTVAHVSTIDAELVPGATSEEVTVRADSVAPIDFETSQVSNLVDQEQMKDLPLITRDPYSLVLLSPGTSQTNTGLGGFTVNGSRERNNNFMLDGVDNNDTSVPGIPDGALGANPDSTQEFRIITNNFNAEYGRNTGAIIDVVTKSGSNQYHGGAYEFGRWNGFGGARDWFNPATDASGNHTKMNPYVRNQFGYSIGGPIIKNKTFFFFNEELDRFRTTLTNQSIVPTAAFKTGKFNLNNDPATPVDLTQSGANNATSTLLEQFGVNQVLAAAPADATMQKVFALYPNPTVDNGDGYTGTLLFPSGSQQNSYNTVLKIDHHFSGNEVLSLRYGYDHFFDPNPTHNDILPGNVGGVSEKAINQGLAANLVSTLTNNLVNSLTFGWNHIYSNFACTGISTVDSPVPALDQYGNGWDFNMNPFTSIGCTALVSNGQFRKTGTTSYTDNISWVHGNHTFKFGFDFRDVGEQGQNGFFSRRQVGLNSSTNLGLSFVQGVSNPSTALNDAAAAYYGFVWQDFNGEFFNKSAARQASDDKHFRQHEYDWFGQDTWKIRRNVTLTLGLRYQLDGVPYEENANFSNLLVDPSSPAPLTMSIVGPGSGKQLYNTDYSNIEPRVGFSWDPWSNGKTAIRGAFGIFHDRVFGNLFGNARGNPPFEQDYILNPVDTANNFYNGQIATALNIPFTGQPFALPAPPTTVPSPIIPNGAQLAPVLFDVHFRNTASNSWNLGIQRELPGGNTIDVSYVGSEGHHIYRQVDGNPPNPTLVNQLLAICSSPTNPQNTTGCTDDDVIKTNLYLGADRGILPFNAVTSNALVQPFYQRSVGNSIFNSLQAKLTHRMNHGLQLQASYTWAHSIDDSNDPLVPAAGNRGFPRNSLNLSEERGNSDNDVRHVAVVSYIWDVPLGRGKGFLKDGVVGRIFEGMQFAGITTAQTGHPFDVFSSTDMERTGLSGRADVIGDPFSTPGGNQTPGLRTWFTNAAPSTTDPGVYGAFSLRCSPAGCDGAPAYDGPGNIGRNHFYGPGFVDFDLAFSKTMKFTERVNAQLRIEGYNIFNHPHFNNPGSDINAFGNQVGSPIFGLITSTTTRPDGTTSARQMQVALKVNF